MELMVGTDWEWAQERNLECWKCSISWFVCSCFLQTGYVSTLKAYMIVISLVHFYFCCLCFCCQTIRGMGENICKPHIWKGLISKKYEEFYNSLTPQKRAYLKWAEDLNRQFSKENILMANKYMKSAQHQKSSDKWKITMR